jgi:hypothetical protein
MKKVFAIFTFLLLCAAAYTFCEHCTPVSEPDPDPCSIPGWCGNGNVRAERYEIIGGVLTLTPCNRPTGQVCGVY